MIVKVTAHEYVWQLVSGEWFSSALCTRYGTKEEAVSATRAWAAARQV